MAETRRPLGSTGERALAQMTDMDLAKFPVLREFLGYLQASDPKLTQSEVGRRAGISQSVVNKILHGRGVGWPCIETYRSLAEAFPDEWRTFLAAHALYREALQRTFAWAHFTTAPRQDPCGAGRATPSA